MVGANVKEMDRMMTDSFRNIRGSQGILVPIARLRLAPLGVVFSGCGVPISLLTRVRGPDTR
jgi:hypothetical protein